MPMASSPGQILPFLLAPISSPLRTSPTQVQTVCALTGHLTRSPDQDPCPFFTPDHRKGKVNPPWTFKSSTPVSQPDLEGVKTLGFRTAGLSPWPPATPTLSSHLPAHLFYFFVLFVLVSTDVIISTRQRSSYFKLLSLVLTQAMVGGH